MESRTEFGGPKNIGGAKGENGYLGDPGKGHQETIDHGLLPHQG